MFSVLSKCRKFDLPIDIQLELFDRMVLPILTYGCEVWGFEDVHILERLHLKFCKYILGLKKSTCSAMVYGELGRFPISINIKCKIISYWLRLVQGKESKFVKCVYNGLHEMYRDGVYLVLG